MSTERKKYLKEYMNGYNSFYFTHNKASLLQKQRERREKLKKERDILFLKSMYRYFSKCYKNSASTISQPIILIDILNKTTTLKDNKNPDISILL